jgi:hypothetical protein
VGLLAVVAVPVGWVAATQIATWDFVGTVDEVVWDRLRPFALVLGVLIVTVGVVWWLGRRTRLLPRLSVLTLVVAFLYAAVIPVAYAFWERNAPEARRPRTQVPTYIEGDQLEAAAWLRREADIDDVLVTNIFCASPSGYRPGCEVNSMWVGGQTGLRMVLGDWGFTPENLSASSTSRLRQRPAPWPYRKSLSERLVEQPSRKVVDELCTRYGARWALIDDRASDVSTGLTEFAEPVHQQGHTTVYRLRCG